MSRNTEANKRRNKQTLQKYSNNQVINITTTAATTTKMIHQTVKCNNKKELKNMNKDLVNTMVYHESAPLICKKNLYNQDDMINNPLKCPPTMTHILTGTIPSVTAVATSTTAMLEKSDTKNFILNQNQYGSTFNIQTSATSTSPPPTTTAIPANITNITQMSNVQSIVHNQIPNKQTKVKTTKAQFKCDLCSMIFGSKSAHTSHTKSHLNSGDIYPKIESRSAIDTKNIHESESPSMTLAKMSTQMKMTVATTTPTNSSNGTTNNGGDPYQCNVCQKTFAVPARLIRHYRTHTGERPFECEFCHKLFSVKENLQVHRRIHTKERPYKCEVCGRAFEHSGKLHRHMRIHTGERPHKCSVCEKTFIQSGQLVIHMRTHTGEKPYKCPVEGCGKGFTCSKQLKVHSRTHTGEKPYHCDICFRDFGYNHVLKLHRVQHYGSKCYKCTICDETFKNKKEMEAHIKGHANEVPNDEEGGQSTTEAATTTTDAILGEIITATAATPPPPSSSLTASISLSNVDDRTDAIDSTYIANKLENIGTTLRSLESPSPSSSPTSAGGSSLHSVGSPTLSVNSPNTDHSHDSGIVSSNGIKSYNLNASNTNGTHTTTLSINNTTYNNTDELPTDLSIHQDKHHHHQQQQHPVPHTPMNYYNSNIIQEYEITTKNANIYQQQQTESTNQEQNSINPALLEAASIASRSVNLDPREEEAAIQILQLNRSFNGTELLKRPKLERINDMSTYEDEDRMKFNEHYNKPDEFIKYGIHKVYEPIPKYESSFNNSDLFVRQVEAAIAPLRSSTESPEERSSSPESDTMLMADRDVMTLPLRKRKNYMNNTKDMTMNNDRQTVNPHDLNDRTNTNNDGMNDINQKVVRMSSVIQFAKAS